MKKSIDIEEFEKLGPDWVLFDVRSPAEYEKGHIPGALNMPLFDNSERAEVGTAFKQESPYTAMLKGLEFVGPKMAAFVKKANELAPKKKLLVHCWRGGKRSKSMAWLLRSAAFEVLTIRGGYKAYRNFILRQFADLPYQLVILGGRTGCGKTEILKALEAEGEQIIDLEKLAHHKGSAFGSLGELPQPSVESFENELYENICQLDLSRKIWVENESRKIGSIHLPDGFWQKMKTATLINIEVPFEQRIETLVDNYSSYSKTALLQSFLKIGKRLGGQHLKAAEEALAADDYATAAAIALRYYDKSYQFMLENNSSPNIHILPLTAQHAAISAKQIISFCTKEKI